MVRPTPLIHSVKATGLEESCTEPSLVLQVTVISYVGGLGGFIALMAWCVYHKVVNNPLTSCFEGRISL